MDNSLPMNLRIQMANFLKDHELLKQMHKRIENVSNFLSIKQC